MGLTLPVTVVGSGLPVTVVAHGLGASVAETRPLVGGLPGTRVLYAARGHGPSYDAALPGPGGSPGPLDAGDLGRDLELVADAHGASQVMGVSMGAGAALSLLARRPDRFERAVLFLPAALDRPRTDEAAGRLARLAEALRAGDREAAASSSGTCRAVPDRAPGTRRPFPSHDQ